jgi:hypothetical protein
MWGLRGWVLSDKVQLRSLTVACGNAAVRILDGSAIAQLGAAQEFSENRSGLGA